MDAHAPTGADDTKTLMKKTAKELQAELRRHALETTGTKAVMAQRLQNHLRAAEQAATAVGADAPSDAKSDEPVNGSKDAAPEAVDDDDADTPDATAAAAAPGGSSPRESSGEARASLVTLVDAAGTSGADHDAPADVQDAAVMADDASLSSACEPEAAAAAAATPEQLSDATADDDEPAVTTTLRIDNFRRPFTLNAVKSLVQEVGSFVENGFWMNAIKTHCYVTYASAEVATKTRERLDGAVWPPVCGIALSAALSQTSAMDVHAHGEPARESLKRSATEAFESQRHGQRPTVPGVANASFLKTETTPVLYYLPWTDEQVKQRKEQAAAARVLGRAAGQASESRGATQRPRHRSRRGGKKRKPRGEYRQVQRL